MQSQKGDPGTPVANLASVQGDSPWAPCPQHMRALPSSPQSQTASCVSPGTHAGLPPSAPPLPVGDSRHGSAGRQGPGQCGRSASPGTAGSHGEPRAREDTSFLYPNTRIYYRNQKPANTIPTLLFLHINYFITSMVENLSIEGASQPFLKSLKRLWCRQAHTCCLYAHPKSPVLWTKRGSLLLRVIMIHPATPYTRKRWSP